MFNRSKIMRNAHAAARRQFELWPFQRKDCTYRKMFAYCLKEAWKAAHSEAVYGEQNARRIAQLEGQARSIEMKDRMCTADFAHVRDINAEIETLRRAA